MNTRNFQLIGRRGDYPQSLLFRDQEGRYYLRPGCGARLVRITARDAQAIMRQYDYRAILDAGWYSFEEVAAIDCFVPIPQDSTALTPEA